MNDRVLYVAYWGLQEPLGRSLVLPAIEAFSARGIPVTLITFEKPGDLVDRGRLRDLEADLHERGVRWHALPYHKRPTIPATVFDIVHGLLVAISGPRPAIVHGRTFVGGIIGYLVSLLRRLPLIYHNEGFWPDQQVEGGYWPAGGWLYRTTKAIERFLYQRADGLILLSRCSRPQVEAQLPKDKARHIAIVPSATDLRRFRCPERSHASTPTLVYTGNLGGRYPVEPIASFLAAFRRKVPSARLTALSLSGADLLRLAIAGRGLPPESLSVASVPQAEVPAVLCSSHAGLLFHHGGVGDRSGSPTKIGEYWAAGLPVVCSTGVGDAEQIIRNEGVGIVVDQAASDGYDRAAEDLLRLLTDPTLAQRCRTAAEKHYSLESAIESQLALYREVLASR